MEQQRKRWESWLIVGTVLLSMIGVNPTAVAAEQEEEEEPELTLRARRNLGFAPVEIGFTGLLRGGADDNERFYCLSAEWDWDDGTRSESIFDCDPYEPGVSEIRRRFSRRHSYDIGGRYEIRLILKKRDEVIATARTAVRVQGGRFPD